MLVGCTYSHQVRFLLQRASPSPVTSPLFVSFLLSHLHGSSLTSSLWENHLSGNNENPLGSYFLVLLKAREVHFYSQTFLLVFGFLLLCVFPDCLSKLVPLCLLLIYIVV